MRRNSSLRVRFCAVTPLLQSHSFGHLCLASTSVPISGALPTFSLDGPISRRCGVAWTHGPGS